MRFTSALFFLATLATSCLAGVPEIEDDIASIGTSLNTLHTSILAFPTTGGTLAQALAIHNNAVNLGTELNQGITDVNTTPRPISDEDCATFLASLEALEPIIDDTLIQIGNRKAAFQALPIGGLPALVKQDLNNLCTATEAFANALLNLCPSDEATALRDRILAACNAARAIYADV
ncbi:hydrophobic surface binding protein A-domain-containing protein [Collybia nuda]|uniref:Hydrophobic surface binding protein A-domain-containing protein n=1 Tax=Collybia nuda TaxID=64659 RepID=A0A9P5XW35_9AGAR|nr:hydrophobic surface binding protein A-domain-containing protein [Collybia nuda]